MRKGTIERDCDYCGKKVQCHPFEIKKRTNIFCSKTCADSFRHKKVKCTCVYCGKETWRKPSMVKDTIANGWNFFCNHACRSKFHKEHPDKKGEWITCDNCGKQSFYESYRLKNRQLKGFFCSTKCSAEFRANSVDTHCKNCQIPLKICSSVYKINGNFCDKHCYGQYKHKVAQENGDYVRYRGPNWYRQRAKAKNRDGFMCCICGETDKALQVHHIIPFKEFNYIYKQNDNYLFANRLENLITLCQRCHKKAEWGKISVWELELAKFPEM